ncbi:glycosyltransferase family 39 protein [Neolewinella antarctica]|uniref:Glycosyltransferase RgtA/B/C/D-like domain-containing protein n=1 Tax=Neolewinella antarctica TaxID=442734 RepID=A0ABX0XF46_9BACT|nr:glycosyltransferase family 39 protein [Neolewinella antarctica]NJC27740.1 hypothetical protein [Neolewinella antarctica]
MSTPSKITTLLLATVIVTTHFLCLPRWQQGTSKATIGWDVSGYYAYLPAIFIYDDLEQVAFLPEIIEKYQPTPNLQQAFLHEASGNYVMKYSAGQAVFFAPFFLVAHAWATASPTYLADGYTFPYQLLISLGGLLYTFIGLFLMRKVLRRYFDEWPTALGLVGLVLGSNYLNYTAVDGAMTHNTLFTVYAALIYATIKYYEKPALLKGAAIGALVGLAALTRPTEILSCLIPLLWGLDLTSRAASDERLRVWKTNLPSLAVAIVVTVAVGSTQLFYWHHVTGDWIVYSYQDEGFSWLRPHLLEGFFSYRSGWLTYSPLMVFSLIGFYPLYQKNRSVFFPTVIFAVLFMYVAFAWDIWWYGGSLGQRTMVQCYPILVFPLCAAAGAVSKWKKPGRWAVTAVAVLFIYANLWFTHQAQRGELLHVGQMTGPYYWATLFRYEHDTNRLKLLDGQRHLYPKIPARSEIIFRDTAYRHTIDREHQWAPETIVAAKDLPKDYDWLRVSATCATRQKEWNHWRMAQFIAITRNGAEVLEHDSYRIHRHVDHGGTKRLYLDVAKPTEDFTDILVNFWNADGDKPLTITDLSIEACYE